MVDARTRLVTLRERVQEDRAARLAAAEQIVNEVVAAARFAKCDVETFSHPDGRITAISLPNHSPIAKIQVIGSTICVGTGALVLAHDQVKGLTYDIVTCRFNVQPADKSPVDIVADRVASVIEEQLKEMGHPQFKDKTR